MKLDLFDEVRVATSAQGEPSGSALGIIVGIGEDEGAGWSYAVIFPPNHITYSFWESELEPTGRKADPQEFAKQGVVRILVDPTGRGRITNCE